MNEINPWEKALLTAGASNAPSMTMRANLQRIRDHRCPRCGGQMGFVKLSASSNRVAMYCNKDRVVIPTPIEVTK